MKSGQKKQFFLFNSPDLGLSEVKTLLSTQVLVLNVIPLNCSCNYLLVFAPI